MFKRIERRQKRKLQVEEIEADSLNILASQDTDSDESSDSQASESAVGSANEGSPDAEEEAPVDDDTLSPTATRMTIHSALEQPIYSELESAIPEWSFCILCPGKILKNEEVLAAHQISNAHVRRAVRFKKYVHAHGVDHNSSAREVIHQLSETHPPLAVPMTPNSNRSRKKKARGEYLKAKHKDRVQKWKAKGAAATVASGEIDAGSEQVEESQAERQIDAITKKKLHLKLSMVEDPATVDAPLKKKQRRTRN